MLNSMSDKIRTNTALSGEEISLLRMTSIPLYKILVVDDKRELRDVLRRTLGENGFAVLTADDGESGLSTALAQHPDLVILDVGLPDMDGLDVCQQARKKLKLEKPRCGTRD